MNSALDASLTEARQWLASDPSRAAERYVALLRQHPDCLEAHNQLERLQHPEAFGHWMGVNCEIAEQDDIFQFFARHPASLNPIRDYLADGWRSLSELMLVLARMDRSLLHLDSVLEFACGHGRLTRHLAPHLGTRLSASDVVPDAVAFVQERLGVHAWPSALHPDQLRAPGRYELVFVLSLFTHLPLTRWPDWINALMALVKPGGLLCFTVHSEAFAAHHGVRFDEEGGCFLPSSESRALLGQDYGTTFCRRDHLLHSIDQALGQGSAHSASTVLDNAFWGGQDAVLIKA